jgi:hypothetical protein
VISASIFAGSAVEMLMVDGFGGFACRCLKALNSITANAHHSLLRYCIDVESSSSFLGRHGDVERLVETSDGLVESVKGAVTLRPVEKLKLFRRKVLRFIARRLNTRIIKSRGYDMGTTLSPACLESFWGKVSGIVVALIVKADTLDILGFRPKDNSS